MKVPKNICIGCLSSDRKLSPLKNEECNEFFNSDLNWKVYASNPLRVCWECIALIRKAVRFKLRVQKSIALLDQLKNYKHISTLSTLTHKIIREDYIQAYHTYQEKPKDVLEYSIAEDVKTEFEFTDAGVQDTVKICTSKDVLEDCKDDEVKAVIEFTDTTIQGTVKLEPKLEFIPENNTSDLDDNFDDGVDDAEEFDTSDDEPLVAVKALKEKEVPNKNQKASRFNISNKPSGVINNVSVQKQLKKWNIADDRVEMVLLSWDEVKEERQKALQTLLGAGNTYKCDHCVLGFNHKFKYDNHMKKHDESAGASVCWLCSTRCRHERALAQHLRRHRVRWRCLVCGAAYSRASCVADHVSGAHAQPALRRCRLCGYSASTLSKLRSHMRVHREPKRCPICSRTFTYSTSLHTHMMIHKGVKEFTCPKCDKQFLFKSAMETHLLTHDNSSKFYCHECDVTFKNRNSYTQHMKYNLKHIDPARLKHKCDSCDKKFAQAHRLHEHKMAVHLKLTPIACPAPDCKFACSSRSALRSHTGVVHRNSRSKRNHVCHVCGKAYITKRNLESHIRSHTGERPFVCSVCPASFAHDAALYNHRRLLHSAGND